MKHKHLNKILKCMRLIDKYNKELKTLDVENNPTNYRIVWLNEQIIILNQSLSQLQ